VKKLIAILLVTGVLVSSVVGCGGSPTTKSGGTTPPAEKKDKDKDKDKA
jgi:hypothetical protein